MVKVSGDLQEKKANNKRNKMCLRYYAGEKLKRRTGIVPILHLVADSCFLSVTLGEA